MTRFAVILGTGFLFRPVGLTAAYRQTVLTTQERIAIIQAINELPDPQFEALVYILSPPELVSSSAAAQGMPSVQLLRYVEGPTGPGIEEFLQAYCEVTGLPSPLAEVAVPLAEEPTKLSEGDWATLFAIFSQNDVVCLKVAFLAAYKLIGGDFRIACPDAPPLDELAQIRAILERYGRPEIAVRFAEQVMAELRQADQTGTRNLNDLLAWRDRVAQRFKIPPQNPAPVTQAVVRGYLLVFIEELAGDRVTLYPELHITGRENPVECGMSSGDCAWDEIATYLSTWINQAEDVLLDESDCESEEILLELFLPRAYMEKDITTWEMKDPDGDMVPLETYRHFVVRSADRLLDRKTQRVLSRKWQQLEECVRAETVCDRFHWQRTFPERRQELKALLDDLDALGLKFVAQWPTDLEKRKAVLRDIIKSAVPVALWSSEVDEATQLALETHLDDFLSDNQAHLTDFANLAQQWRLRRLQAETDVVKRIKLLCDCPDRLPTPPDPTQDSDLFVAA
jgi:hypothetical protein